MPIIHASAVAAGKRAALIVGASGSGKSSLALQLIGLGARLICDDRVTVERQGAQLILSAAPNISGLIEARGVGLLQVPTAEPCPAAVIVDLDHTETERLPERRRDLLGVDLPLFHKVESPAWPAALWFYLISQK